MFVNVGNTDTTGVLSPAPAPTAFFNQWVTSSFFYPSAEIYAWINGHTVMNGTSGVNLTDAQTRTNLVNECLKLTFYTDELTAKGYSLTSYLGPDHVAAARTQPNPMHPGDAARFHGCLYDLENVTGEAYSPYRSQYLAEMTTAAYYALNPNGYVYDVLLYGLKWTTSPTNSGQWTDADIGNLINGGATGFSPGLYNSGAQSWTAYNSFVINNEYYYARQISWYYAFNGQYAKLWPSLPAFHTYSDSHIPYIESVYQAATDSFNFANYYSFDGSLITGMAVYYHVDGTGVPDGAQYLSTSTWKDWPYYCSQWVGTNCDNAN